MWPLLGGRYAKTLLADSCIASARNPVTLAHFTGVDPTLTRRCCRAAGTQSHWAPFHRAFAPFAACVGTASELRSALPVNYRRADFGVDDPFTQCKCSVEWGPLAGSCTASAPNPPPLPCFAGVDPTLTRGCCWAAGTRSGWPTAAPTPRRPTPSLRHRAPSESARCPPPLPAARRRPPIAWRGTSQNAHPSLGRLGVTSRTWTSPAASSIHVTRV
eukprot:362399-Chlamydomonas_euryale.AAC.6